MFAKIIVGIDGTERGRDALALGRMLARETGASLLIGSVYPAPLRERTGGGDEFESAARAEAEGRIAETAEALDGVRDIARHPVADTSSARGLQHLAEKERADLIVVGSSHRGAAGRVLPGSVGERLLHGAPCAVAVAPADFRKDADPRLRVIGVGYDGTPHADAALRVAAGLASHEHAALRIVTVVEGLGFSRVAIAGGYGYALVVGELRTEARSWLDSALEVVPPETRPEGVLLDGDPAEQLVDQSETLDLLVTGSRGYGMLGRVVLGGVSAHVVRDARCPVIVVPSVPPA